MASVKCSILAGWYLHMGSDQTAQDGPRWAKGAGEPGTKGDRREGRRMKTWDRLCVRLAGGEQGEMENGRRRIEGGRADPDSLRGREEGGENDGRTQVCGSGRRWRTQGRRGHAEVVSRGMGEGRTMTTVARWEDPRIPAGLRVVRV